jgi:cysteine sulfinate desulfinase/cysteine desulfurase-like protein
MYNNYDDNESFSKRKVMAVGELTMQRPKLYGTVRISFGRYTTREEITWAGERIGDEITRLRELALE